MVVVARNARHVRFFGDTAEPAALFEHGIECLSSAAEAVLELSVVVAGRRRQVRFRLKPNREGRIICVTEDITAHGAPAERRALSMDEPLPGVMTSARFVESARRELRRVARHHSPLALVRIELDPPARRPEGDGSPAGAEALRGVVQVLRDGIRDTDLLAHVGAGALAVLLVHTDGEHGRAVIERLRETISIRAAMAQTPSAALTISAGVVEHRSGERLDDLLRRAETALCRAKAAGRDRVCLD